MKLSLTLGLLWCCLSLCSDSELVPPAKQPAVPAPFPNATVVYDPPGDGSCQFAAVAHQLNRAGIPDDATCVRKSAVLYMSQNPYIQHDTKITHMFEFVEKQTFKDWNEYLTAMDSRRTFGDHLTLQSLSNAYNARILVLTSAGAGKSVTKHLIEPVNKDNGARDILLCIGHYSETSSCHYVSIQVDNIEQVIRDTQAWSIKSNLSTASSQQQSTHHNDSCKQQSTISCVTDLTKHWWAKAVGLSADKTGGRTKYRCEPCGKFRGTIGKMHSYRGKVPGICSESGIVFRASLFDDHFRSPLHEEAVNAYNVRKLSAGGQAPKTPMSMHISRANEAMANHVGGLMIEIYNNAKRGTVSAFSWPSCHVAHEMGSKFSMNSCALQLLSSLDLKYLNPAQHCQLMQYIVDADRPRLKERIQKCVAVSIAVDGSVDRFLVDNKHVNCRIVTKNGAEESIVWDLTSHTKDELLVMWGLYNPPSSGVCRGKICLQRPAAL